MSSARNYNTRQNSVSVNRNVPSTPENSSFSELIMNLEKTMLMRFDGVDKELLSYFCGRKWKPFGAIWSKK